MELAHMLMFLTQRVLINSLSIAPLKHQLLRLNGQLTAREHIEEPKP